MSEPLDILFLGEPSSANTIQWVEGLRRLNCRVRIASARSDGSDGALPIGPPGMPPRLRVLAGQGDVEAMIRDQRPDILLAYRITSYGYLAACTGFHPLVLAAQNEQIVYSDRPSTWRRFMMTRFARYAIRRADLIHAWGDNIRRGLLKFGADDARILVMHRGIDLSLFFPDQSRHTAIPPKNPVFVSTRSLTHEYRIDLLLHAFSLLLRDLPNASLHIIGDGPERIPLETLAARLGITDRVRFLGRMPVKQVADEIRKADVYVSLIGTEGISSSLIECCACGLVPVVADIPASRELVRNGEDGLLVSDDSPRSVADAMKRAALDSTIRNGAIRNAVRTAERFDRNRNLLRFVSEYRKLCGKSESESEVAKSVWDTGHQDANPLDGPGKKRIHVCHVTTSHRPNDIRIFQRECCGLVRRGFQVSLVARGRVGEVPSGSNVHFVPIRYIFGRLGRKFILPKIALVKARRLGADIYHFHDPELLPWMAVMAKHRKAKVVWDVHELYGATIHEFHLRRFRALANLIGKLFDGMERIWCRSFSGIVAVTEPISQRYREMGFSCETIRNTIDLERIPALSEGLPKAEGFSIVASGTTNESRRVYELLEAIAIIAGKRPEIRLKLLASFDSPRAEKRIRSEIKRKGLSKHVDISPLIEWKKLMTEELRRHHLGMVLYGRSGNNNVGIPNRLFEYWACRLPVVATDTPLLSEIIERTGGGIAVNSDSPYEIASGILHYMENPELLRTHGERGYEAVLQEFNWNRDLDRLTGLYERILGKVPAVS